MNKQRLLLCETVVEVPLEELTEINDVGLGQREIDLEVKQPQDFLFHMSYPVLQTDELRVFFDRILKCVFFGYFLADHDGVQDSNYVFHRYGHFLTFSS